jgi:hypothetical protein
MKKLALIGIAVVVGGLTLAGSALAKPTEGIGPLPSAVNLEQGQNQRLSRPVEQATGMTPAEYHALLVRSEALNRKYGLGIESLTIERGSNDRFSPNNPAKDELVFSAPSEPSNGFAWDDAGIGAGIGAGALALIAVVGTGFVALRRSHRPLGTS